MGEIAARESDVPLLTQKQVAEILGLSVNRTYGIINRGELPRHRKGPNSYGYRLAEVLAYRDMDHVDPFNPSEVIRKAVKDRLKSLGMTQKDLAAKVGMTDRALSALLLAASIGRGQKFQPILKALGLRVTVVTVDVDTDADQPE